MGHADFRVGGKMIATLAHPSSAYSEVRLTPQDQIPTVTSNGALELASDCRMSSALRSLLCDSLAAQLWRYAATHSRFRRRDEAMRSLCTATSVTIAATILLIPACSESARPVAQEGPCPTLGQTTTPTAYFEFQVAVSARIATGFPRYQQAALPGEVLFQVVVDPCGFPDLSTFKVLKATRSALADRTRTLVAALRFLPAELDNGQRVPQLVQEVFEFR
jgi:hypothetical protein